MEMNWDHILTGVITGVITGAITGFIPFLAQCRWRRQDRADAAQSSRLAESRELAALIGECIANHELTMRSGHFSSVIILKNLSAIRQQASLLGARLDSKRAADLQRLVDEYGNAQDYKATPGLALERARKIQQLCGV